MFCLVTLCLSEDAVKMPREIRRTQMGQNIELDPDGDQDLLPRPWSKGAASYPNKWLAGWPLGHFH